MIGPFQVEWTEYALERWRSLSLDDAKLVAEAVKRFADAGEGTVIYLQGEYLLLVRAHVVAMLIYGETVYILHVRSARNG